MTDQIARETLTREFFDLLDETFENHHGIFLDRDTSLFITVETVSAIDASLQVAGGF